MLSRQRRLTALLVSARHAVCHWDCVRSRRDGDAQPLRAVMRHAALQTWDAAGFPVVYVKGRTLCQLTLLLLYSRCKAQLGWRS
jgi:hypothetical protein